MKRGKRGKAQQGEEKRGSSKGYRLRVSPEMRGERSWGRVGGSVPLGAAEKKGNTLRGGEVEGRGAVGIFLSAKRRSGCNHVTTRAREKRVDGIAIPLGVF